MRLRPLILSFSTALLLCIPGLGRDAKPANAAYALKYAGGTLPLKANSAVKMVIANSNVIVVQGGQYFVVPSQNITGIACGTDIRRRFGASVLGIVPLVDLDKAEDYYIGVTWADGSGVGSGKTTEVLFKLSRGDYYRFLPALETATGVKAVDTKNTPRSVRYDL